MNPRGHRLATTLATMLLLWLLPIRSESAPVASTNAAPPNIVFILADDLGIHDLGCYGRAEHRTPHLDRLAAEGTRFTSAYCAQPICSPSRAAILSGLAPARLHLTTFLPGRADAPSQKVLHPEIRQALPLDIVTLPERLKSAGYLSACLGKWHLGGKGAAPADQGFDLAEPGPANTTPSATEGGKGEYSLTARAEAFLEKNRDRPFLLYLAHDSPHIPYTARTNLVADYSRRGAFEPTYAAVIETLDDAVGRLLAKLEALHLAERTLVIFTSDNGGLHVPELRHARITHNGPYRAGKGYLYEGGLRVPLIVRWPGKVPARRVVDSPMINTDWVPTLLELAGLPAATDLDGLSMARVLLGQASSPERTFHWHFPHYTNQGGRPGGAARQGRWKLVEYYDTGDAELYDLEGDPGETRNLAASEPRRVERLRQRLSDYRQATGAQANRPNPDFDPSRFAALYRDFDPSRFQPRDASPEDWVRVATWRRLMDEVVRKK